MTVDSGGQELGTKTTPQELPKPTIDQTRLDAKVDNASCIGGGKVGQEKLLELSKQKAGRIQKLIGQDPQLYLDGGSAEEVVVDASGDLVVSGNLKPSSQESIWGNYLSTEIAISALYTSTPAVDSLPPSSFAIPESGLARSIDARGILLTAVGVHEPNIRTRFYSIPGQLLDSQKKPIPLGQQRVLIVQDIPVNDGRIRRIYTISTQEDIAGDLESLSARIDKTTTKNVSGETDDVINQATQEQTAVQSPEVGKSMRYVGLLADNVLAGRSNPLALQNYVDYAIGNGVPRELIDLTLQSKGITVRRLDSPEAKIDPAEKVRPIIDKLRANFPDQPAGVGRLGIEVQLTPEEIKQIQVFLGQRGTELDVNPNIQNIRKIIDQLRTDKAYAIKYGFGQGVVEDSVVSQPAVEQTSSGPVVKLPPELYKLWKSSNSIEGATQMLTYYVSSPLKPGSGNLAFGTSAASFANVLEGAI